MGRIRLIILLTIASALWLTAACTAPLPATSDMDGETMEMADEEGAADMGSMDMASMEVPTDLDMSTQRMSEFGLFKVSYAPEQEPIPLNEMHSWILHVETADGQPVENATITVDGGMPQHDHGLPTAPAVTEDLGGGDYRLEGVKFHMNGWWEVKISVDDGQDRDEVTFNLMLK